MLQDINQNRLGYLLMLPAIVYTFIYGYMTLPWLLIAFQRYSYRGGILGSKWVGLKNFEFFFKSNNAWLVTKNTIVLNLIFLITGTVAAVLMALLVNELRNKKFSKIVQSTLLFPHFISWIVVSYFVVLFLSTDEGIINGLLEFLKMEPVNWYQSPNSWPWIFAIIKIWKVTGFSMIIYLAAVAGFDNGVYEAAEIDGCSRINQIKYITIPLLLPIIMMLTIMSIGTMLKGDFGMIYPMIRDNGLLYETTDVIDTYIFRALKKNGDLSSTTAIGLYQSIVGFILVYSTNKFARKYVSEGALF